MSTSAQDERPIVWFDIDNTLYSASAKISQAMGVKIHDYFVTLGMSDEEASELHLKYYTQYGLALAGLVRYNGVDPLDFDRKCDQSLPLEEMIKPNPAHRKLFEDIDRSKVHVWALTNAYRVHAERVLHILNLQDQFEGLVYCDYAAKDLTSKPDAKFYQKAMKVANVSDPSKCYFIDDNIRNVEAAKELGWGHCVHFCERGLEHVEGGKVQQISNLKKPGADDSDIAIASELEDLRMIWPEIFKAS